MKNGSKLWCVSTFLSCRRGSCCYQLGNAIISTTTTRATIANRAIQFLLYRCQNAYPKLIENDAKPSFPNQIEGILSSGHKAQQAKPGGREEGGKAHTLSTIYHLPLERKVSILHLPLKRKVKNGSKMWCFSTFLSCRRGSCCYQLGNAIISTTTTRATTATSAIQFLLYRCQNTYPKAIGNDAKPSFFQSDRRNPKLWTRSAAGQAREAERKVGKHTL